MTPELSPFDSVITFSQSLGQWTVLILGGTVALLMGNSHISPKGKLRGIYLIFLPVWGCLLWSNSMGVKVQRNYLALKLLQNVDPIATKNELNQNLMAQIVRMEWALGLISIWLVIYLIWWVFSAKAVEAAAKNEKSV